MLSAQANLGQHLTHKNEALFSQLNLRQDGREGGGHNRGYVRGLDGAVTVWPYNYSKHGFD